MNYLIDTNICIYVMKQHPLPVIQKFRQFQFGEMLVSSITVSELQYGVSKSKHREKNQQRLDQFLRPLTISPYDEMAARMYGDIRAALQQKGTLIGPLDMLIAAHALALGVTLVTNNEKEFQRVDGLNIENWARG